MTNGGWIKLWRKILDSDMWKHLNSKQRDITITLLLMVAHKGQKVKWGSRIVELKPGQIITSLSEIKNHCAKDVSIQNIRTCLSELEKWQFLTNKSTKKGRLITIVNWELYQSHDTELTNNLTISQQRANKELTKTTSETMIESQSSSPKNVKNDKNVKNIYKSDYYNNIHNNQKIEDFEKLIEDIPDIEFCNLEPSLQKDIITKLVKLHFKKFPWSKSVHKKIRGSKSYTAFVVRTRQYFEGIFQKFPTLAPVKIAKAIIEAESDKPWVYYPEERAKKERYLTDKEIQERISKGR